MEGVKKCMEVYADERTGRPAEILAGIWSVFGAAGSVAIIGLLPLGLMGGNGRARSCFKLVIAAAYVVWVFTERNGRYLAPLLPLAAALGASAAAGLEGQFPRLLRNMNRFLAAACVLFFGMRVLERTAPARWHYLAGNMDRAAFLREMYTTWEKTRCWVNANVPESARIVAVGEPRRLWFKCRVASHGPVYQPLFWRLTREAWSPAQIRKRLKQLGYSHCLYNFTTASYRGMLWFPGPEWSGRQLGLYEDFMGGYMRVEYISQSADHLNGGFYVYSFLPKAAAKAAPVHYLPSAEGMLARAARMMKVARYSEIGREFARLEALMPRAMFWREIKALYLWERKDFTGIRALLGPILDSGYFGETAARIYAGAALNLDRYQDAIEGFPEAWRITPLPEVYYSMGLAFLGRAKERADRKEWNGALKDVRAAISMAKDPSSRGLSDIDTGYRAYVLQEARAMVVRAGAAKLDPVAVRALAALRLIAGGEAGSGRAARKE